MFFLYLTNFFIHFFSPSAPKIYSPNCYRYLGYR